MNHTNGYKSRTSWIRIHIKVHGNIWNKLYGSTFGLTDYELHPQQCDTVDPLAIILHFPRIAPVSVLYIVLYQIRNSPRVNK